MTLDIGSGVQGDGLRDRELCTNFGPPWANCGVVRPMHSLEGLTNIGLNVRNFRLKRDIQEARTGQADALAKQSSLAAATWYWSVSHDALLRMFMELARECPDHPMLKPTGGKRENGQPEYVFHKTYDRYVLEGAGKIPQEYRILAKLKDFIRRRVRL